MVEGGMGEDIGKGFRGMGKEWLGQERLGRRGRRALPPTLAVGRLRRPILCIDLEAQHS